jgi:hypothetical protein
MKTLKLAVMIFLSLVLCAGCAGVGNQTAKTGTPDGYRYQQDGVTLEFDSKIGVYEVVELPEPISTMDSITGSDQQGNA